MKRNRENEEWEGSDRQVDQWVGRQTQRHVKKKMSKGNFDEREGRNRQVDGLVGRQSQCDE